MFRPASRLIARSPAVRALPRPAATRRFLSTAPPSQKSRSWKSSLARWGAAGAIIYYYNTMDVFAEEPEQIYTTQYVPETNEETEQLPTIDALAQQRAKRKAEAAAMVAKEQKMETSGEGQQHEPGVGGVEELEEEAGQQGAFNPETGEINWDCPCLGGMATGPCGEQFKAAFSCFVYSTEEPKGMDCIDRFKDMQNCFREYPEIYGSELDIDEEDDVTQDGEQLAATMESSAGSASTPEKVTEQKSESLPPPPTEREAKKERPEAAIKQDNMEIPKASHDATQAEDKQ